MLPGLKLSQELKASCCAQDTLNLLHAANVGPLAEQHAHAYLLERALWAVRTKPGQVASASAAQCKVYLGLALHRSSMRGLEGMLAAWAHSVAGHAGSAAVMQDGYGPGVRQTAASHS